MNADKDKGDDKVNGNEEPNADGDLAKEDAAEAGQEKFSSEPIDNTNAGDAEETKEDITNEPKEKGKKNKKMKKKKNRPEMWANQAKQAERRRLEDDARSMLELLGADNPWTWNDY